MFRFLMSDPKILRDIFTAISTLLDEGTFNIASETVMLQFSTDMPIMLDFKQPYDGKLVYCLAPSVET